MKPQTLSFPTLLQDFFYKRLVNERAASAQTIASYRDTFSLLLHFAQRQARRPPSAMTFADIDSPMVLAFLNHLEETRGNSPRTRNLRLTAIRSFMHYASIREPAILPIAQRILAIPSKRFDRPILGFLSREEVQALLAAPDHGTFSGHRDAVLFATLYNTGARVSEITRLNVDDVLLNRQCALHLHGKGRKERVVPLWKSTVDLLNGWFPRINGQPQSALFPNRAGRRLTRSGIEYRLRVTIRAATDRCPSLATRRISPHTFRHTTAMHLLQSGVDITVIALWLGHENITTTHHYIEADLAMKEDALLHIEDPSPQPLRFRAPDSLIDFLDTL